MFIDDLAKPSAIHSSQITRSTLFTQPETNIQSQNKSAFRPHVSQHGKDVRSPVLPSANQFNGNHIQHPVMPTQNMIHSSGITNGNGALYKSQQPPPVPNIKRTESTHKSGANVGITNPSGPSSNYLLVRQQQPNIPQFHQSMFNLSSIGTSDTTNTIQAGINMLGSRVSLHPASSNFMKHPAYTPQSNKINGHHPYHQHPSPPAPSSASSRPPLMMTEDPIMRWIQQVNNSSSVLGLTSTGGANRPQQQTFPYGAYTSTGSSKYI